MMRLSADKHEGATTALGCGVLGYPIPQVPGMVGSRRPTPVHLLSSFAGVVFDRPSALPCHNLLVTPAPGFVTSRGCRLALRLVTSDRTSWSRSPIVVALQSLYPMFWRDMVYLQCAPLTPSGPLMPSSRSRQTTGTAGRHASPPCCFASLAIGLVSTVRPIWLEAREIDEGGGAFAAIPFHVHLQLYVITRLRLSTGGQTP